MAVTVRTIAPTTVRTIARTTVRTIARITVRTIVRITVPTIGRAIVPVMAITGGIRLPLLLHDHPMGDPIAPGILHGIPHLRHIVLTVR